VHGFAELVEGHARFVCVRHLAHEGLRLVVGQDLALALEALLEGLLGDVAISILEMVERQLQILLRENLLFVDDDGEELSVVNNAVVLQIGLREDLRDLVVVNLTLECLLYLIQAKHARVVLVEASELLLQLLEVVDVETKIPHQELQSFDLKSLLHAEVL